jgi:hypothetical protein
MPQANSGVPLMLLWEISPPPEWRLFHAERDVVEMLLDGELTDLGDAGVIDVNFIGRMRWLSHRRAKHQERRADPRLS